MAEPPEFQPRPTYPTHDWGGLAKDPWMKIGATGEAWRRVLRRIWWRTGGDPEKFDEMIPPEDDLVRR